MTSRNPKIIIIGAGMCGLACARCLQNDGLSPIVLDKGRGLGGRVATRRTRSGYQFDHGAQYFTARDAAFRNVVEGALQNGAAAVWESDDDKIKYVGLNGMSGFSRYLGRDFNVSCRTEVLSVVREETGWHIVTPDRSWHADRVVVTVPAPQLVNLLGPDHTFHKALKSVRFDPCFALMVAANRAPKTASRMCINPDQNLAWIADDSAKPRRDTDGCWVAHATPDWSIRHLELDKAAIVGRLLPLLCKHIGREADDILHADVHRWRYARVSRALDQPYLRIKDGSFYAGGDWCLESRVEAAWTTGEAIARDLLVRL